MNAFLKFVIGLTCIAVLAYVGYFFWEERQAHLEARREPGLQPQIDARIAEDLKREAAREREKADAIRLTAAVCEPLATATIPYEMTAAAKTAEHNEDLAKCAELDRLSAYHRNRLELLGII